MHKIESSLLDCINKFDSQTNNPKEKAKTIFIAFSGGLDSSVLLFASKQLFKQNFIPQIKALHVNHGIENGSDQWQSHCESICSNLSIELVSKKLNLLSADNKASENNARIARYDFFESQLVSDDLISFAHHQDDQVETLLFRLFRGTGISGAGAIPTSRKLGNGMIIRPFLNISKKELLEYAQKNKLEWVEDPSNKQNGYARNVIRNTILPLIKNTWPKVVESLNNFTHIAREQNEVLRDVASEDLQEVSLVDTSQIELDKFIRLSIARQKNLLHYWIASNSENNYSRATYQEINELIQQLKTPINTDETDHLKNSKLNIKLGNCRVRVFDKKLWLCQSTEPKKILNSIDWNDVSQTAEVSDSLIVFSNTKLEKNKLAVRPPSYEEHVTIKPRLGGEKVKPHYRDKSCDLKKIYQELKIPHWQREWLPIICYNNEIVCVPGVFANKKFLALKGEKSIIYNVKTL